MQYPCQALGRIEGLTSEGLIERLSSEFTEHGLRHDRRPDGLSVLSDEFSLNLHLDADGLAVSLGAPDREALEQRRAGFVHMLEHADPAMVQGLTWCGDVSQSGTPANIRFARVVSVADGNGNFLRITLGCDRSRTFTDAAMHFRLLLPPPGRAPVWPRQDPSGRTVWPSGEDTLHRPAYTFVEIDEFRGEFTFDLFRHAGGRATAWALAAHPGDAVTVMGPGGGDFPPGDWLLMGGDETALPAIRRILASSAPSRRGAVFVETADPADREALPAPPCLKVTWLTRGEDAPLLDHLRAVALPSGGESRFVWLGAEKSVVRAARAHFRDRLGMDAAETYFSGYWSRS